MKTLYTAKVTAFGGRDGKVKSEDGVVDFEVKMPKSLGGTTDEALNPELLFAAGYAACFDSALQMVMKMHKVRTVSNVMAEVSINTNESNSFELSAVLQVKIKGISIEDAETYTAKAHQVCPYSLATKNNINVELNTSVY